MTRYHTDKNNKHSLNFSSLTIIRIFVKFFLLVATLHFIDNYTTMLVIVTALVLTECYRVIGDYLLTKGVSNFIIGSIISAANGAVIVILLQNINLLYSDLYFVILLSIIIDTLEYGIEAALAEGITAGFSYAIILLFLGYPLTDILIRAPLIIFVGLVTGWLSSELYFREKKLAVVSAESRHEERLNNIKDEFISIASHNLRTPLTALKGYIYLFLNGRLGDVNDKQRKTLENMDKNVDNMLSLIEDFIKVMYLESSKLSLNKSRTNIRDLLDSMVPDLQAIAKMRSKHLDVLNNLVDTDLNIDVVRIRIAVENIVHNALKYSKEKVSMEINSDEKNVVISVRDDGKGIEMERSDIIFKKFNHFKSELMMNGENATTENSSGLGLYIARMIIEGHHGKIEVSSEVGKGTTFKIILPIK